MPRFYPQNLKRLQQYHRPDREQTENGKISIFRCVLHRSSQNSLFGQVAGPFQEIISQPHRTAKSSRRVVNVELTDTSDLIITDFLLFMK